MKAVIRQARDEDLPVLLEMSRRFLRESPYALHLQENPEQIEAMLTRLLRDPKAVILLAEDGESAVGMFGFVLSPHPFSDEPMAFELAWWVAPERRQDFTGFLLLRKAEEMAREMKAKKFQVSAPDDRTGMMYEKLGYSKVETQFQRAL